MHTEALTALQPVYLRTCTPLVALIQPAGGPAGEFWGAPRLVILLLTGMLLFFAASVGLLIGSVGNTRSQQ